MKSDKNPSGGACSFLITQSLQKLLYSIHMCLVQCAPCKLRPLIIIIASSTEIAAPWYFSCVCGFPLLWCWWIFFILRQKLFLYGELSCKKLATSQASFSFMLDSLPSKNFFLMKMKASVWAQRQATHTEKISGSCNFCGGCNYKFNTHTHQWNWDLMRMFLKTKWIPCPGGCRMSSRGRVSHQVLARRL